MSEQNNPKKLIAQVVDQIFDPDNIKSSFMVIGLVLVVVMSYSILDGGGRFLLLLKESEVSRGLITFLVSLTTVVLAIILVLYAITASDKDAAKERFSLGKDVLSTLVGILGTVLGFYFGSADKTPANPPAVAAIKFQGLQLVTHVSGGVPPYRYSIASPNQQFSKISDRLTYDGWITETLDKQPADGTPVTVSVSDARDKAVSLTSNYSAEQTAAKPAAKPAAAAAPAQPAAPAADKKP